MRLRSLEQELDLQLVNRGQRFESFTAPGERVLARARTVLAAYDGLQAEAAACRGFGRCRFAGRCRCLGRRFG